MKPRNKMEKRVAELNATLNEDISVRDAEWAKKESKKWDMRTYCYFTIFTNIKEWEVKRLYRIYARPDKSTTHYFFVEVMRQFSDGTNTLVFTKQRAMNFYYDSFCYATNIELRRIYKNYAGYQVTDLFGLSMESRCQSRGKRIACDYVDPNELARIIRNNPVAENLYKNNDGLFGYLLWKTHCKEVCRAITIAKRHGFDFSDTMTNCLWFDMVRSIIYCKKDYHNPVFVAPKDLQATHDKFVRMKIRKMEQDEIIRKNREADKKAKRQMDYAKMYEKNRKKFFDMVLKKGSLAVSVLTSIDDFKNQSEYFHNCVYSNEYWNLKRHPYSLIMVAEIGGNRAELVEVDLADYKVKQCFGKHNQFTNYHQRIVDFINSKMRTIKAYNENKKQIKKAA